MDDRALARWRMQVLGLTGAGFAGVSQALRSMLAVQAENYAQAMWAVAARIPGLTMMLFEQLFRDGAVLRTHVLRPTWHFVAPEDIRWLVDLTAPGIRRSLVQLQGQLGVDDATLAAATAVITQALAAGVHLTRDEVRSRLQQAGLPADGRRLGLMLMHAECNALICSGAPRGKNQTYALLEERAPSALRLDREEALGRLALRYFAGHGPATERDLAYWATLTLTEVRAGMAAVGDQLEQLDHEGRTYWYAQPAQDAAAEPRGHLLQILDEYFRGYQDSRYVLDAEGLVPRGRSATVGMALVDGQMVGEMRRTIAADHVGFAITLYRRLDEDELAAVHQAADRYGEFLGLPARVDAG